MTLSYGQVKQELDKAYEQGVNHAFKFAKIVAMKNHDSIEAYLLDLSVELAKLKIEMNHTEEKTKDIVQLPPEGRSPWIENGNELNFYLVGETSADSDRIMLKPGEWKIINYERPTNLVIVEKISPSP